jgi:peptidyl-tRNA hydrolase, PTH1 family
MEQKSKIIVGLGNPGREYHFTRHNIGFLALERISEELNIGITSRKLNGLIGEGRFRGEKIILVKPGTFMNLSGICVREVMTFFRVPLEDLFVISDDFNLPFGTLRIRRGGSSGGHKGLASIIQEIGSADYSRLRVGIGPLPNAMEPMRFVLEKFSDDERKAIPDLLARIGEAFMMYCEKGLEVTMSTYNAKLKEDGPASKANELVLEKGKQQIMENSIGETMG